MSNETNETSALKVAVAYADKRAYSLANDLFRNVARKCPISCRVYSVWWCFDGFESAAAVRNAARVAGEADMIWCSTHACKPVPGPVVEWLNEALKLKGEARTAFVALLQCPAGSSVEKSAARTSIASVARSPGVDFFLQRFDCDCRLRVEEQMRKSRAMHLFC